jgi:hypothetical protein
MGNKDWLFLGYFFMNSYLEITILKVKNSDNNFFGKVTYNSGHSAILLLK